jgi:hypothetical protein
MGIAKQGKVYGNASVLPLIGGSGAGGVFHDYNDILRSGGAGGGAILIAAKGTITINGVVSAQGGKGGDLSATPKSRAAPGAFASKQKGTPGV